MPNESEQKPGTRGTSPSSSSLGLGRRSPDESKRQPALWPTLAPDERPSSSLGETPPLARRVPESSSSSSSGLNFLGQRSPNESERQPAWPFFYARARQTSLRAAARAFFGPRSRSSLGFGQRSPGRVRGGAAWVCFGHRSSEEPQQSVWPGGPLREERDLTVNHMVAIYIYIYIYIYESSSRRLDPSLWRKKKPPGRRSASTGARAQAQKKLTRLRRAWANGQDRLPLGLVYRASAPQDRLPLGPGPKVGLPTAGSFVGFRGGPGRRADPAKTIPSL